MVAQWVVLLEVAREPATPALDAGALYDALDALAETNVSVLRSDDRCAVQMEVGAALTRGAPQQAVLFVDLDDFRETNERLGAPGGDAFLVAVAQRITGALDAAGTAARLGGDQFAVLLENSATEPAVAVAERIL